MGGWGWRGEQGSGLGLHPQGQRKAWGSRGLLVSAGPCSFWLSQAFQQDEFQPTLMRSQSHSPGLSL